MINNNSGYLQNLELGWVTFTEVLFNEMMDLTELTLSACRGSNGLISLFHCASNLKKLNLINMNLDATIAITAADMKHLKELELQYCRGEISTLLTQAAPRISLLILRTVDVNNSVEKPFSILKKLKLENCKGDISSLLTQAASCITSLHLYQMDNKTVVNKPFTHLQLLEIKE